MLHAIACQGLGQVVNTCDQHIFSEYVAHVTPRYGPITLKAMESGIRLTRPDVWLKWSNVNTIRYRPLV